MGNSTAESQSTPKSDYIVDNIGPKVEISHVQQPPPLEIDVPEPFITNIPESVDLPNQNNPKPKRELPPLKKNRSSKKLFQISHTSIKQNIASQKTTPEAKQTQPLPVRSHQRGSTLEVCQLKQIQTDIESNYIEKRTKKMRVSKKSSHSIALA